MPRFRLHRYEMQLVAELQRQQNCAQFCDTLLQTDGISVPTHSCVLAALSPYLFQQLSGSPFPPCGQKRHLQLQAVKAQTLLKLVGLLYSGQLEVEESVEQEEVLAAARQFGMTDLVMERAASRITQDAQVQVEMGGWGGASSPVETRRCLSTGTQTVRAAEDSGTFIVSSHTKPPTPEPPPSASSKPANISADDMCSNWAGSTPHQPASASNPTSRVPQVPHPESMDSIQGSALGRTGLEGGQTNGKTSEDGGKGEEMAGEEREKSSESRHANMKIGMKNMAKMKNMMETQISVKVKLRRRTKGEVWEVVSVQDAGETLSVLTSLTQDGSNHKRSQREFQNIQLLPSMAPPASAQRVKTQIHQPATTTSPKPPAPPNTTCYPQPPSGDFGLPDQNGELMSAPVPQPQGHMEESDEQIEKLLEDIMMGLNILPSLDRDCKTVPHLHPNRATCQEPEAGQSRIQAVDTNPNCAWYQDFGTHSNQSSTDAAENQPECTGRSAMQLNTLLIQPQQRPPQYHLSVRSVGQTHGRSHQHSSLPKSQNTVSSEPPPTGPGIVSPFYSGEQKPHYPAFPGTSSQEGQNVSECLRPPNGSDIQCLSPFSLSCMDELRLPRCLSPIETFNQAAVDQVVLSSAEHQQPSLQEQLWLSEHPGSLRFPLSTLAHGESKLASSHLDDLELNPQHGRPCANACTDNREGANATELKSQKMKGTLLCDSQVDAVASKRKRRKRPGQQAEGGASSLPCKNLRVSDETKNQMNLSLCSVSLSRNNVLAKEREMSTSSSSTPSQFVWKPKQSTKTEHLKERPRRSGSRTALVVSGQTPIRTRGFLRKTQEITVNPSTERASVPEPGAHGASVGTTRESPCRHKRGRPQKIKLEAFTSSHSPAPITSDKSYHQESRGQNEDFEKRVETKKRCKKRKRKGRAEAETGTPLKKTASPESPAEAGGISDATPPVRKTPKRRVTLKEIQKLIKCQHTKTRKSRESQESNETLRIPKDEAEEDKDAGQLQDRGAIPESPVTFNVTVDEIHNPIFSTAPAERHSSRQDDSKGCCRREASLSGDEKSSVFPVQVLKEDPNEGLSCTTWTCDRTQTATKDTESHHHDSQQSQEHKMPSDPDLRPQDPESAASTLRDAGGSSKSSDCHCAEEEEEVDVLCCSPEKAPQARGREDGLHHTDSPPHEEEEEEDANEIDVTGDETE